MSEDKPLVSVICTCFNQEEYIADALESFVTQKTNFPFEVIVHDDASTDSTGKIVERYANNYPNLIIPFIEKENQYSQGIDVHSIVLPQAKGKYIALCEGDDYWASNTKLQRQFDYMESHPDCSLCIHNAYVISYSHDIVFLSEPANGDRDKTTNELILEGGGLINPTASFFFRSGLIEHAHGLKTLVTDHFIIIELATKGKVHWICDPLSVYRWEAKQSWSSKSTRQGIAGIIQHMEKYIKNLDAFDELSSGKYHEAFSKRIHMQRVNAGMGLSRFPRNAIPDEYSYLLEIPEVKNARNSIRIKSVIINRIPDRVARLIFHRKGSALKRGAGTLISSRAAGFRP